MSDRASYQGRVLQYDIPVSDLSAYALQTDLPDLSVKQDKLLTFNIAAASYTAASQVSSQDAMPKAMTVNPAGTTLIMFGLQNDTLYEYSMSTAWDLSLIHI